METYTGRPAQTVGLLAMLQMAWAERRQVLRYLRWLGAMRRVAVNGR